MELTLQLFSARNTELNAALEIIAAAGYQSVEAYGDNLNNPDAFRDALQANGLAMVSAHIRLEQLESSLDASMELVSSLGASHIVCPYLQPEDRPTSGDSWLRLANKLAGINDTLSKNNFTFAWHNHDFEMEPLDDGNVPMQLLLDNAPGMHWEVDIGWIVRAGANPQQWLQTHSDRISAIHLKDVAAAGEKTNEDGWADVGHGVINWSELVPDIQNSAAKLFIVEHDNPSDLQRFAEHSIASIKGWS